MVIKKVVQLVVDASKAVKGIKSVNDELKETDELAEKAGKSTEEAGKKTEKAAEDAAKGTKKLNKEQKGAAKSTSLFSKGMGVLSNVIKFSPIGFLVGLLAKLGQAFMNNQQVVDGFNVVMTTVSNVMTQIVGVITNVVNSVSESTNGFEKLGKVVSGLLTLAFTPLKGSFFAIKLAVQQAQLAWEQSFFGDKDQETIKTLREGINETKADLLEVATDALNAGKQVAENFGGAVSELGQVVEKSVEGLSKVSVKAANESAKASVEADKAARLAAARIQGVIEEYDREAEALRQVRDDTSKSVEERIAANDKLGEVLQNQLKEEQKLINVQLNALRLKNKGNESSIEFQEEEIRLKNELAAVTAKVTGFESEQLTNRNALLQEGIDIRKELMQIGKDETEAAIQDAQDVLDERRRVIEREIKDDAEKKKLLAAAESDYQKTLLEIQDSAEQERFDAEFKKLENDQIAFDTKLEMIKSQEQALLENQQISGEKRIELQKQLEDKRISIEKAQAEASVKIEEEKQKAKETALNGYASALGQVSDVLGKETAAGKALAVASSLISTYSSIAGQLQAFSKVPVPGYAIAQAVATGLVGLKSVQDIISVKVPGESGGANANTSSIRGGSGATTNQPAFNLVGRSNVNQLQTGLEQQETAPVKAFVVSTNVTTQQEADRATESQAAFG